MQGQLFQLNEDNERLTHENHELNGSLATQNEQDTNELANRDSEILRISILLRVAETDRDGFRQLGMDEIARRDGEAIVLRQLITIHEAEIERIYG